MFVIINKRLEKELADRVETWVNEQVPGNDAVKEFLIKSIVEYEANQKGFTIYLDKASYPIV